MYWDKGQTQGSLSGDAISGSMPSGSVNRASSRSPRSPRRSILGPMSDTSAVPTTSEGGSAGNRYGQSSPQNGQAINRTAVRQSLPAAMPQRMPSTVAAGTDANLSNQHRGFNGYSETPAPVTYQAPPAAQPVQLSAMPNRPIMPASEEEVRALGLDPRVLADPEAQRYIDAARQQSADDMMRKQAQEAQLAKTMAQLQLDASGGGPPEYRAAPQEAQRLRSFSQPPIEGGGVGPMYPPQSLGGEQDPMSLARALYARRQVMGNNPWARR